MRSPGERVAPSSPNRLRLAVTHRRKYRRQGGLLRIDSPTTLRASYQRSTSSCASRRRALQCPASARAKRGAAGARAAQLATTRVALRQRGRRERLEHPHGEAFYRKAVVDSARRSDLLGRVYDGLCAFSLSVRQGCADKFGWGNTGRLPAWRQRGERAAVPTSYDRGLAGLTAAGDPTWQGPTIEVSAQG
jgi:hypothetical protein